MNEPEKKILGIRKMMDDGYDYSYGRTKYGKKKKMSRNTLGRCKRRTKKRIKRLYSKLFDTNNI